MYNYYLHMLLFSVDQEKVRRAIDDDIVSELSAASKTGVQKYNLNQVEELEN
jgi:hypothetical protein